MTPDEMAELTWLVHWWGQQQKRRRLQEKALSQCAGKDRFETHNQAQLTIRPRLARFAHAYQCSICGQWHVGGMRAARSQRVGHLMAKRGNE